MTDGTWNRRTVMISGAAALAALGLHARGASAAPMVQSGGGIAGGGSVQANGGPAEFTVFGSRFVAEDGETLLFLGSLQYLDVTANQMIESVSISAYGPVEGSEDTTRQMSGIATINGEGAYPFDLVLVDGGGIGEGADMFDLALGADGASVVEQATYEIHSNVQSGGLQLIEFAFEAAAATPTPAG